MSDFFIAGSWRNRLAVLDVVEALEGTGASSYSFVRAAYDDDASACAVPGGADDAKLDEPGMRELFEQDLAELLDAE